MATELEQGIEALKKGMAPAAIAHLEKACQENSRDHTAWQYLGAAYQTSGRYQEAIEPMRKAALLQPKLAQTRYNLGLALEQAGQPQEAAAELMQALAINPNYTRAKEALARLRPPEPSTTPAAAPSPFAPWGGQIGVAPVNPTPVSNQTIINTPPPVAAPGTYSPLGAAPLNDEPTIGQAPGYASPLPTVYSSGSGYPPPGAFPPSQAPAGAGFPAGAPLPPSKPAAHKHHSSDAGVKYGISGGVVLILILRIIFVVWRGYDRIQADHQADSPPSQVVGAGSYSNGQPPPPYSQPAPDSGAASTQAAVNNQAAWAQQQQQQAASRAAAQQNFQNQMQAQQQQINLQQQQAMQRMQVNQAQTMSSMHPAAPPPGAGGMGMQGASPMGGQSTMRPIGGGPGFPGH